MKIESAGPITQKPNITRKRTEALMNEAPSSKELDTRSFVDRVTGVNAQQRAAAHKVMGPVYSRAIDTSLNFVASGADAIGFQPVGNLLRVPVGTYNFGHYLSGESPEKTQLQALQGGVETVTNMIEYSSEADMIAAESRQAKRIGAGAGKYRKVQATLPMSETAQQIVPYNPASVPLPPDNEIDWID